MSKKRPIHVFVSSTWVDLRDHRETVQRIIRQLGAVDISMEHFGAREERPKQECLRLIRDEADVFVGIYAHRYGHVPKDDDVSILEAEYEEAIAAGLKCLVYLIDEDTPWSPKLVDKGTAAKKLARFKKGLLERHICKSFQTADGLAAATAADLGREFVFQILPKVKRGSELAKKLESIPDWTERRTGIYRTNRNVFLAHTLRPSAKKGQEFDIAIYLIPHRSNDPRYRREDLSDVVRAEFFLGVYWNNRVFDSTSKQGMIGMTTSAYGPFLCLCRVHFDDGESIVMHRYIDFEMGDVA